MHQAKFQIILVIAVAAVSAQFPNNNRNDEYDYQGNLIQRTPSFLRNQQGRTSSFGAQAGSTSSRFGGAQNHFGSAGLQTSTFGNNANLPSGQTAFSRTSQFGSAGIQSTPFGNNALARQNTAFGNNALSRQNTAFGNNANQFSGQNSLLGNNQFNRQQGFARTQQFSTAEAGAQVLSERSENDGFGPYSFGFETDNGITREETAVPTGLNTLAVTGSYSYTSPEGVEVIVRYTADENGFQVESPNVPAIPPHAQLQIEAAREAKARGLIDENGNPTSIGLQQNNLRSLNSNNQGLSNLQNLVNQNSNFRNQNGAFAGQSQFRSNLGNAQRTAVLRRPFDNNSAVSGAFGSHQFGQSLNDNGKFSSNAQRFNQQSQFGQGNSFGQNARFGQSGQFVTTPGFQNQRASRLSVQEGNNFRTSADLHHGSQIHSGATGNVASYRVGN